ncbi:unnamed protein product, partial [marine sediment metagenome]
IKLGDRFKYAQEDVDFIYDGLEKNKRTMVEESIEEFGGTTTEQAEPTQKEKDIARARELVKNPHLGDPVDNTMATVLQKKQVYGYINEEGKKIGGMVDSQYIKKEEVKNIGKADKLTKAQGIKYWDFWYGKEGEIGERDKREIEAKGKEQEGNPLIGERQPLERRDKDDNGSLNKDLLIEKIQELRKKNYLEDDEKFGEALGCNAKFKLWTEKELTKLKEKLEIYRPSCLK